MKAHVSEAKKNEVKVLKDLIGKYRVIGIIDLKGLPSAQMQKMKNQLRNVLIRVTKKRLLRLALEDVKGKLKGIEKIEEELTKDVMPSLILTNEDSFKLAKSLRKRKTSAAAKPGQIAPRDITIPEGPTPFTPGPIIGELGMVGIKAAVEGGKIVVKKDCLLVKQGEIINNKKADILAKFGIEPMEIGLNLLCTYEQGMIYDKSVLDVDDSVYIEQIKEIGRNAVVLAVEVGYYIKDTAELFIKKAYLEAKGLENSLDIKIIEEKPKKKVDDIIREEKHKAEKKPSAEDLVHEISEKLKEEKIKEEKKRREKEAKRIPSASELAERKKNENK